MKPLISFVTALNRVNTHGDLMDRFRHSLRCTTQLAERFNLDYEFIVVDWNSEGAFPLIRDPFLLYTVTKDEHERIDNPHGQLFFEWRAKNVGIRMAEGRFILCMNADDIFSSQLMERLTKSELREDTFYRVNRYDIKAIGEKPFMVKRASGDFAPGEDFTQSKTGVPYSPEMLHFNASGDFMLMSRRNWFELRGYPETEYDGSVDGQAVWLAHRMGLKQCVLDEPLLHLDHVRGGRKMHTPAWSDAAPFGKMNGEHWGIV